MLNHHRTRGGEAATEVIGDWSLVADGSDGTSLGDAAGAKRYWVSGSITGAIVWERRTSASAEAAHRQRRRDTPATRIWTAVASEARHRFGCSSRRWRQQELADASKSGVALRLPAQSKATLPTKAGTTARPFSQLKYPDGRICSALSYAL